MRSVITGTFTGAVNEGDLGDVTTATGTISISDVDDDDSPTIADVGPTVGDNGFGSFELVGGTWTYTLDQSAVQNLDAGDIVNDTITYTAIGRQHAADYRHHHRYGRCTSVITGTFTRCRQ